MLTVQKKQYKILYKQNVNIGEGGKLGKKRYNIEKIYVR